MNEIEDNNKNANIKDVLRSMIMTFSIYSKIPMPNIEWKEVNMKYTMCFFPLVGLVHGLIWILWFFVSLKITDSSIFRTLTLAALPFILDGGIHLDGFLDVNDAIHSYGEPQRKLEIMKDSHIGAFAVIYGIIYIMLWTAVVSLVNRENVFLSGAMFCLARAMSGVTFVMLKGAKNDGMQHTVSGAADNGAVILSSLAYAVLIIAYVMDYAFIKGIILGAVCVGSAFMYKSYTYKNFGGITGDTAGWYMQLLIAVLVAVVCIF